MEQLLGQSFPDTFEKNGLIWIRGGFVCDPGGRICIAIGERRDLWPKKSRQVGDGGQPRSPHPDRRQGAVSDQAPDGPFGEAKNGGDGAGADVSANVRK